MVWVEEHDKRSFLLDLMDAAGLGAKDLDGEVSCLAPIRLDLDGLISSPAVFFIIIGPPP